MVQALTSAPPMACGSPTTATVSSKTVLKGHIGTPIGWTRQKSQIFSKSVAKVSS